jgi:hypothetical protein
MLATHRSNLRKHMTCQFEIWNMNYIGHERLYVPSFSDLDHPISFYDWMLWFYCCESQTSLRSSFMRSKNHMYLFKRELRHSRELTIISNIPDIQLALQSHLMLCLSLHKYKYSHCSDLDVSGTLTLLTLTQPHWSHSTFTRNIVIMLLIICINTEDDYVSYLETAKLVVGSIDP